MFRETWERFDRIAPWKAAVIAGMVAWILTTFLYSPPFWVPLAGGGPAPARIDDFNALCANPWHGISMNPSSPTASSRPRSRGCWACVDSPE